MSFARKIVLLLVANPAFRSVAAKYGLKLGAGRCTTNIGRNGQEGK